jgi:uncharacterized repeat protein (TIGR02543 family)
VAEYNILEEISPIADSYIVSFNANGGSGTMSSITVESGKYISLPSNGFTAPSQSPYSLTLDSNGGNAATSTIKTSFSGKWLLGSITGKEYSVGASFSPTGDTVFYAGWTTTAKLPTPTRNKENTAGYKVTLNANGGECEQTSISNEKNTTYAFLNWNSKKDGTGSTYSSTLTLTASTPTILYAKWSSSISYTAISLPIPKKKGYKFKGWSTSNNSDGELFDTYTPTSDITLYAIWEEVKNTVYIYMSENEKFVAATPYIYDGTNWK